MKAFFYICILPLLCGGVCVQSASAQGLGKPRNEQNQSAQQQSQPQNNTQQQSNAGSSATGNQADAGEDPDAQALGMSFPLLDPATDTVSYNGSKFDVGNNALVRARFEKYLQQNPDDSTEARRYHKKLKSLVKLTQKSARAKSEVGSEILQQIGTGLYELNEYEGDGGVSSALASAIASAVAVQYANRSRDRKNESLQKAIDKLVERSNMMANHNAARNARSNNSRAVAQPGGDKTNSVVQGHNAKQIAKMEAAGVKNDVDSVAALELSKINFQSTIVAMLMQRRFDHALIGAHIYRHVFRDGDTTLKLDSESQAARLFEGGVGLPPTVNTMATISSNTRREVDQNMEAVANMLAMNNLADATQSLIQAVAVGEYMQSVATFPAESRRRIAEFWALRRKSLTTLNARDYGALEEIAAKMKELDPNFDDSLLTSYCAGRMAQSNLHLRNAAKALKAGDDATFNVEITKAGKIWPKNPNLEKGRQQLEQIDDYEPVRDEFRSLISRKQFRTIYNEQDKFEVVALDPELKTQYKEALTVIGTIDGMLAQLEVAARQDVVMGPCMAYEMLLQRGEEDARYKDDYRYRDALNQFALAAHEFTQALDKAKLSEERREYGSALSNYYRAQCLYPRSTMAGEGARRVTEIILKAKF